MLRIQMSLVTYMNGELALCVQHIWMRHVTHTNESNMYECVMSCTQMRLICVQHIGMRPLMHTNESNMYECVILRTQMSLVYVQHIWMRHVPHTNESNIFVAHKNASRYAYKWVLVHTWMQMSRGTYIHEYTWVLVYTWMATLVRRLVRYMNAYEWFMSATRELAIHMCNKTHMFAWQVIWGDMNYSYVWHASDVRARTSNVCSFAWYHPLARLIHIWMSMSYMNKSCYRAYQYE